jgi:hypothetical protein
MKPYTKLVMIMKLAASEDLSQKSVFLHRNIKKFTWTFPENKMLLIFWVDAQIVSSQERLSAMKLAISQWRMGL